jgi:molybdopterin/thiamine biosynthesis adenylyltransferase
VVQGNSNSLQEFSAINEFIVIAPQMLRLSSNLLFRNTGSGISIYEANGDSLLFENSTVQFAILSAVQEGCCTLSDVSQRISHDKDTVLKALRDLVGNKILQEFEIPKAQRLTEEDAARYRWQFEHFKFFESQDQTSELMFARLRSSKVLIVGLGGLGSSLAIMLASAGILNLNLVDGDVVALDNLPRQLHFSLGDIGSKKVEVASRILRLYESRMNVVCRAEHVTSEDDALKLFEGIDFCVLCADQPRLLIDKWIGEASLGARVPYMSMSGTWVGPISVPFASPCYVCQARFNRSKISDFDGFVRATAENPLPPRAAFGPGPSLTAAFMACAVIEYLAKINPPRCMFERFNINLWGECEREKLVRYCDCPKCGSGSF